MKTAVLDRLQASPKKTELSRQMSVGLAFIALLFFVVAVFWITFLLDAELTRDYVMEDGFFYIKTANNFGSDLTFTFDGFNSTNGFHYLYMPILVGLNQIVSLEGLSGVRAVILLHGALTLGAGLFAALFAGRVMGSDWRPAAFIAVVAVQAVYSIGTEAALLSLVAFAFLISLVRQQHNVLNDTPKRLDEVSVAILAVILCLARTEAVILPVTCGVVLAVWHGFFRQSVATAIRTVAITAVTAVVASGLIAAVNIALTGHPLTISAYLKSDFPDLLHNEWLSYKGLSYKARIVGPIFFAFIAGAVSLLRLKSAEPMKAVSLLCWLGFNAYIVIYTLAIYLFAIGEGTLRTGGVQPYYFDLVVAGTALNVIFLVSETAIWLSNEERFSRLLRPAILWAPVIVAASFLLLGAARFQRFTTYHPSTDVVNATTADWLRDNLPGDSRILAIDHAGVMGYVSDLSIVNGDGLVNSWEYWEALRDGALEQWLRENGVSYIYVGTGEGDPVGRLETRDGRAVVVARLELRGTESYELVGSVGDEIYQSPNQWIFPISAVSVRVVGE